MASSMHQCGKIHLNFVAVLLIPENLSGIIVDLLEQNFSLSLYARVYEILLIVTP